jgi:hypothetical protein
MKRLRTIGLILLALLALGSFAASTASAEEGLLPTQEAKEASGKGGAGTLATAGSDFSCTKVAILEVKFLAKSDLHGTFDLHLSGCKVAGTFPINSLGDVKEVILEYFLFLICLITSASLDFGLLLLVLGAQLKEEAGLAHLEIPSVGALVNVKGAIIAKNLSGLKGDKNEGKLFKYELKGSKGKQEVATSCEINGKKLSNTLQAELNETGKPEALSWNTTVELEYSELVALMDA